MRIATGLTVTALFGLLATSHGWHAQGKAAFEAGPGEAAIGDGVDAAAIGKARSRLVDLALGEHRPHPGVMALAAASPPPSPAPVILADSGLTRLEAPPAEAPAEDIADDRFSERDIPGPRGETARSAGPRPQPRPLVAAPPRPRPNVVAPEEVEPAAGVTLRRDPVDLPLLEETRWQELILSVTLNGEALAEDSLFIEDPTTGRLAVDLETAEAWRLRVDEDRILTFDGLPFYPLDAIEDLEAELDRRELAITLEIPPETFEPYTVDATGDDRPDPSAGIGGFLDYDLLHFAGDTLDERLDGLFEAGAFFGEKGVLLANLRVGDITDETEADRLETTFFRDFPDRRATLRLGDSLTQGGAFARGIRFGGFQWSTNFATDPSFVTFPLPSIGGLVEQRSVVDVVVENLRRTTEEVPSGPFAIRNLPVVTGAGEVQIRVTDLLGRERLLTQDYYVSSRLLREDLHEFSYDLGFERQDFAQDSFNYGDPLLSATHRYGFAEWLTGEAHLEAEPDRGSLSLGGALRLGNWGVVSGGLGGSVADDVGSGVLGQLDYEYLGRDFNLGLRSRYTSEDFRQFGDDGVTRRVDQASIGFDMRSFGRIGLLFLNQDFADRQDARTVSANYSLPVGPGTVVLNGARTLEPDEEFSVIATYSIPLGRRDTVALRGETGSERDRARIQYQRSRGASDLGLDARIAGEVGDDSREVDGRLDYQTSYAGLDLDFERFDGDNNLRSGINGSLAFIDGDVAVSRRIGRAFGMVDLPGYADVRVYLDNRQVGRTNAAGRLLLPRLRPYEENRVRIEVDDLPIEARIGDTQIEAVPFARTGVTVPFEIETTHQATAILLGPDGAPLPAGLRLESASSAHRALVAKAGLAQIDGALDEGVRLEGETSRGRITCDISPQKSGETIPHLGEIVCEN